MTIDRSRYNPAFFGAKSSDVTEVIVTSPAYFAALETIFQGGSADVIADYLRYSIIRSVSSYLTQAVRDENLRFSAEISGQSASPPVSPQVFCCCW